MNTKTLDGEENVRAMLMSDFQEGTMRSFVLAFVAVMLCVFASGFAEAGERAETCARVVVTTAGGGSNIRTSDGFSVQKIDDLLIIVGLHAKFRGVKTLKIKLYTPNGHLYREMEAAVGSIDGQVFGPKSGEWLEEFKKSEGAQAMPPGSIALFTLPVAGTDIAANSLYGEWETKVYLSERAMTCERRFFFKIKP